MVVPRKTTDCHQPAQPLVVPRGISSQRSTSKPTVHEQIHGRKRPWCRVMWAHSFCCPQSRFGPSQTPLGLRSTVAGSRFLLLLRCTHKDCVCHELKARYTEPQGKTVVVDATRQWVHMSPSCLLQAAPALRLRLGEAKGGVISI